MMRLATSRAFSAATLKSTPITDYHAQIGGKLVEFAGYNMPVEYKDFSGGVLKEHLHCRNSAGLFDVSHMG
jgi:aminomethyltransferase